MKAAILVESKKPLIIDEIEISKALQFGQVLVDIKYSGICGAQINEIDAVKGPDSYLPHLLGHEGSGVVEKIGEGVTTVKPGDHVVLHWVKSKGIQSLTPQYTWKGKQLNAGWVTTFNEKAIVSENRLTVIPNDFDLRLAPLFGCAITTGFGAVNNDARIKIGQSVVIFGVGGVGLNIAQAASMVSAYPIIGIDIHDYKINLGKKFGLTHGVLSTSKNYISEIKDILNNSADVVFETTGISNNIEEAYNLTAAKEGGFNGRTILVGVPKNKVTIYSLPLHFGKVLTGSHGGSAIPDLDIPKYIRLIKNKKMSIKDLVTHEFNLSDINQAIDLFRSGQAGRIIIKISP